MKGSDSLPVLVSALASAISQGRGDEELALLAAVFTLLGDSITLILSGRVCGTSKEETETSV